MGDTVRRSSREALRGGRAGGLLALVLFASPTAAQIRTENAGVISPELTVLRELATAAHSENLDELR